MDETPRAYALYLINAGKYLDADQKVMLSVFMRHLIVKKVGKKLDDDPIGWVRFIDACQRKARENLVGHAKALSAFTKAIGGLTNEQLGDDTKLHALIRERLKEARKVRAVIKKKIKQIGNSPTIGQTLED